MQDIDINAGMVDMPVITGIISHFSGASKSPAVSLEKKLHLCFYLIEFR